jgi:hypothetical protein
MKTEQSQIVANKDQCTRGSVAEYRQWGAFSDRGEWLLSLNSCSTVTVSATFSINGSRDRREPCMGLFVSRAPGNRQATPGHTCHQMLLHSCNSVSTRILVRGR